MSPSLSRDIARGSDPQHPFRQRLRRLRDWVGVHPRLRWLYKLVVGLMGGLVVVVGVILIPLPGPGWLVVFVGLAILGTEFPAAARGAAFLKRIVTRAWGWWQDRRAARAAVVAERA